MISKNKLKEHIYKFPEKEISIDELADRLFFIQKLEQRIENSEREGSKISEEEIKEEIQKWSK